MVPVALRMPHRPLAAATLQCIASAALKPYPSIADVAQYLVSRLEPKHKPLISCRTQ